MPTTTTEAAAYEAYKAVMEAAYQSGGMKYVLQLSKIAALVGDSVAKRSKDYGLTAQGASEELAREISGWAPGLLKRIAEQK